MFKQTQVINKKNLLVFISLNVAKTTLIDIRGIILNLFII